MFKVEKKSADLIEIEIGGKITADEMSKGLDTLLPMTEQMKNGRMLALYHDIEFPEAGAILEEMKRLPQLFGMLGKVTKVALVSDQKWIRDIAELEGTILPGMSVRSFTSDERAQAEAFLKLEPAVDEIDDDGGDDSFPV